MAFFVKPGITRPPMTAIIAATPRRPTRTPRDAPSDQSPSQSRCMNRLPSQTMASPPRNMISTCTISVNATAARPPAMEYKPTTVPVTRMPTQMGHSR
jgi:hypothetical protein